MVKSGFPKFGMSQGSSYITILNNYNLPDFILKLVAQECDSELLEKGRIESRLQSMNDDALKILHKIFVECENDDDGKYATYRFFAYISSMYHKCEILLNETIPGQSEKNHRIPIAVKNNSMYIAIAFNKSKGKPISKKEIVKFYDITNDVKLGDHGTQLLDAVFGSSVGFTKESMETLQDLSKSRINDTENKLEFKTAFFDKNIYSTIKC